MRRDISVYDERGGAVRVELENVKIALEEMCSERDLFGNTSGDTLIALGLLIFLQDDIVLLKEFWRRKCGPFAPVPNLLE